MRNLSMLVLILLPSLILGQGDNSFLEIEDEEPATLQRIKFRKGQSAWDFDLVKNHHQSPINIKTGKIQILDCDDDNNLVLSYVTDRNIRYILRNNGHGVEVVMDEEELRRRGESIRPHLSGGILPETYIFENLHFHWGQNNFLGSEHTIDKQGFSFEIHMVTFKESYRTFTNAVTFKDGIVVLTFFAEVGRPNNAMNAILRYLPNVQRNGTQTPIVGTDALVWFAEQVRSVNRDYIAYPGSLTTPPYAETVTFFILPTPIPMSQDQLQQFRNLQGTNGTRLSSYRRERQFNLRQRPIVFVPHNFELYHTPLTNNLPEGPDEEDEEGHHGGEPDGGTWSD